MLQGTLNALKELDVTDVARLLNFPGAKETLHTMSV